ncbi:MAG: DNA polymerase I [Microscillaceae bacterium]|jgi:DNA polymerase-1|nr:DNA polymerase I [Microscillaceae bacterium]
MNKLFLLDAFALIYRAHFAFSKNPRINSKGMSTGAVLGFTNTLLDVIKKEKPTHIGVAFDTPEPTFRHLEFKEYKAQREAQPEDITTAIPYIYKMVQAFNIPILVKPGFEADDVIGTLAKKAKQHGDFEVFMMTPDKDYSQIVEENIFLYKPAMFGNDVAIWGVSEVLAKWEITDTKQVIDILGLQGDAVDNIPGIPGIGEKTAIKLVQEFGSVENLIANVDKLKGKQQENVRNFAQQGLLSKKLATIDIEVPIEFNPEALQLEAMNETMVRALFDELEFKTLKERLFKEKTTEKTPTTPATKPSAKAKVNTGQIDLFGSPTPALPEGEEDNDSPPSGELEGALGSGGRLTIANTVHHYYLIDNQVDRKRLIDLLNQQTEFCLDTETTGLDALSAELVGLSISCYPTEAYYIPFPADQTEAKSIISEFKEVFENQAITKIGQNIKYDYMVLQNYGIELQGTLWDTMLAHYLIEPDMRHNMDVLAENYLNYSPVSIETLIGKKGNKQGNMRDVPLEDIKEYAAEDADITLQLKYQFAKSLPPAPSEGGVDSILLTSAAPEGGEIITPPPSEGAGGRLLGVLGRSFVFFNVETPLIPVLADMERAGVKIDTASLKDISTDLTKEILATEKEIYTLAGTEFNIASPKQLGEILFERLKLDDKAKKTKTGQYATGEEILVKLTDKHLIINKILDYREIVKLKNTYVDALPALISPLDGRLHTTYQQAVAATGRLSSINPNLQNIPIRTAKGREIRKAFVASSDDFVILSADYSQIELRIMAHFAKDETMLKAFQNGEDIHAATAAKVFKVPLNQVDSDMRRKAKTANFGIIYGISAHGLAQRLNIPRGEAGEIIRAYFEEFSAIKKYMDNVVNQARENEYVQTILGRRRYLRNINSQNAVERGNAERNAINAPIQGSAADMIKLAMIGIHKYLKDNQLQSKMLLQVHDELVFEAHKSELDILQPAIAEIMKNALKLEVPMEVGMGTGRNWLEAH